MGSSSKCLSGWATESVNSIIKHLNIHVLYLVDEKFQSIFLSAFHAYSFSIQGILRLRGRPSVAYDQQGLVFAVAMEGGAIKLFDSRSYDKVCIETLIWKSCI